MAKPWKCSACSQKFRNHHMGMIYINAQHQTPKLIYLADNPPVERSLDQDRYWDQFSEPAALGHVQNEE